MIEWGCLELEHFYLGLRLGGGGNWCPSSYETLAAYVHFILICKTKDTASRRQTELKGAFCFCIRSLICGRAPIINVAIWYLARLIDYLLKDVQQQKLCACILMMLCARQPQPLRLLCPPLLLLSYCLRRETELLVLVQVSPLSLSTWFIAWNLPTQIRVCILYLNG